MNISLAGAKKKKSNKTSIGYGLNKRGPPNKSISDAFDGSSSSDDDDDDENDNNDDDNRQSSKKRSHRNRVNQQIAKEQAALRRRAQIAVSNVDASVYDYDGAYDSFQPDSAAEATRQNQTKEGSVPQEKNEERKSRYIGDLLKAAKKRERERDAVYERKVAKEQAEEDLQEDYQGKEKFVTRAYKRKLEERKQWEMEEKRKEDEEEQNDVTKRVGGAAFASFYGNLNRNVAVGGGGSSSSSGGGDKKETSTNPNDEKGSIESANDSSRGGEPGSQGLGFLDGFEQSNSSREPTTTTTTTNGTAGELPPLAETQPPQDRNTDDVVPALSQREIREKKVFEARQRYLKRKAAAAVAVA